MLCVVIMRCCESEILARRADGWTDGRMDGWTDGRMDGLLTPQNHHGCSMDKDLTDEKKAAMRKDLNDNTLPEKFALLESFIGDNGLFFDKITMADIAVYTMLNWIGMGVLDGISGDIILSKPKLKNFVHLMNENEAIKKWNSEKNGKLPWF